MPVLTSPTQLQSRCMSRQSKISSWYESVAVPAGVCSAMYPKLQGPRVLGLLNSGGSAPCVAAS